MRNFNRRNKRVAGPGFHVNVKIDQFAISAMRGRHGGISRQSAYLPSSGDAEIYDIKEQELLVSKRKSAMYHDGFSHVFSAINGYHVPDSKMDKQAVKDYILKEVAFMGIATTEQKSDDSQAISQGLVSQVGGVTTILNNGNATIHPTDKVMLDINLEPNRASITRDKGIPRDKIRFSVRPADDDEDLIKRAAAMCSRAPYSKEDLKRKRTALKQKETDLQAKRKKSKDAPTDQALKDEYDEAKRRFIEEKNKLAQAEAGEKTCNLKSPKQLKEFMMNYRHLNSLVIGKAMSFAKPGDRFEIMLQPRHSL